MLKVVLFSGNSPVLFYLLHTEFITKFKSKKSYTGDKIIWAMKKQLYTIGFSSTQACEAGACLAPAAVLYP